MLDIGFSLNFGYKCQGLKIQGAAEWYDESSPFFELFQ
jgi:hypothetical protein